MEINWKVTQYLKLGKKTNGRISPPRMIFKESLQRKSNKKKINNYYFSIFKPIYIIILFIFQIDISYVFYLWFFTSAILRFHLLVRKSTSTPYWVIFNSQSSSWIAAKLLMLKVWFSVISCYKIFKSWSCVKITDFTSSWFLMISIRPTLLYKMI